VEKNMAHQLIEQQPDWKIVKVTDKYVAVTPEESTRIFDLQIANRNSGGLESLADEELFTAYEFELNPATGRWQCNGNGMHQQRMNTIQPYIMALLH
jgi:hypothetical protein